MKTISIIKTSRRVLLGLLVALTLLCAPRPARALEMALELEVGTSLPLGSFPDGVPVALDDPSGQSPLGLGIADSAYNLLLDGKVRAGFSTAVSLLMGNWYIRGAFSFNTIGTFKATHYAVRRLGGQDMPSALHNVYLPLPSEQEVTLEQSMPVYNIRLGFGRRWYLLGEGLLRPYLMMGLGGLIAIIDGEANGGMTFHAGGGVDIYLGLGFDLGVKAYYEWMGVILPSNFQASSAASAIGSTTSSETSVFEAFLESMHTLQITATATYRF